MKTHEELGISAAERDGLLRLATYLRNGATFVREEEVDDEWEGEYRGLLFNMNFPCDGYACGTVACIGGHLAIFLKAGRFGDNITQATREWSEAYVRKHYVGSEIGSDRTDPRPDPILRTVDMKTAYEAAPGISKLFYPRPIRDWDEINDVIAAEAIDNFLRHGTPDWAILASRYGIEIEEAFR